MPSPGRAADTIVLGETVCAAPRAARHGRLARARPRVARRRQGRGAGRAGVDRDQADLRLLERQAEQQEFTVEGRRRLGAAAARPAAMPLVLGPHINIYNRGRWPNTPIGASRWVAPVELSLDALALINPPANPVRTPASENIATEAWVFGRLPLAFSARCFTARHHRVFRDDCGFRCIADPDRLLLSSSGASPSQSTQRHADAVGRGAEPARRRARRCVRPAISRLRPVALCAGASAGAGRLRRGDESWRRAR